MTRGVKKSKKYNEKFARVMQEFQKGRLYSGPAKRKKVTSLSQARAIAHSEALRAEKQKKKRK